MSISTPGFFFVDSPRVEQRRLPGQHLARGLLPAATPFNYERFYREVSTVPSPSQALMIHTVSSKRPVFGVYENCTSAHEQGFHSRWINHVWRRRWANFIPPWIVVRTEFALSETQLIRNRPSFTPSHEISDSHLKSFIEERSEKGPHKQKDGGLIRYWMGHVECPVRAEGGMLSAHGLPEATAEADQWGKSTAPTLIY